MNPARDGTPPGRDADDPTVVALVMCRDTESVPDARFQLERAGFGVGPASGPVFAIEAPAQRFGETFGATPVPAGDGGWTTDRGDELPLDDLPSSLQQEVALVALERPVELH